MKNTCKLNENGTVIHELVIDGIDLTKLCVVSVNVKHSNDGIPLITLEIVPSEPLIFQYRDDKVDN